MEKNIASNFFEKSKSKYPLVKLASNLFDKDLLYLISLTKAKSLYSFGCGRGNNERLIKDRFGHMNIVGSDLELESIKEAKQLHPEFKFVQDDITNSRQKSDSFDIVTAFEVLEHLEDPEKAVKECRRVSKKYCLFSVPNEPFWRLANLTRLAHVKRLGNSPGHLQNFSRGDIRRLLNKHFSKVKIITSGIILWNMAICKK